MRNRYKQVLSAFFHHKLFQTRGTLLDITQEEMAHRIGISTRAYVDLENGKTTCSAVTLALFLVYVCNEANKYEKSAINAELARPLCAKRASEKGSKSAEAGPVKGHSWRCGWCARFVSQKYSTVQMRAKSQRRTPFLESSVFLGLLFYSPLPSLRSGRPFESLTLRQ